MDYRSDVGYAAEPSAVENPYELNPVEDVLIYLREYARERPEVVAFTCFAVGFILGWKLKPW
jgi:hypothetical protein